ncbi:MAG: Gfo/Idh/MocA family oxidoreductase [Deferribacteres bacterium]|nr:Gfo/Idh/MocA family oxidoreductase [candidate division KSB1 bacterium]MCB9509046.1 Gfo/Idh/MocA family oxidoreductase [Deferribacteres bacterium]
MSQQNDKHSELNRRDFIKLGAAAGAAVGMIQLGCGNETAGYALSKNIGGAPDELFKAPPMETVRIGFVGVGGMGSAHVRNLLRIEGVELKAVCDIVPERVEKIQNWVIEAGQPKPTGYSRSETDFVRMCEEEDLDLVYTATPWRWHVPVCVAAMKNGKHSATEVPAAVTIDECWEMVETAEKFQKHCVMMENCNYGREEMMVFNMVRQGLFGEILHGECGYLHDLRAVKFDYDGEGLWRREHSKTRNGNLYPTHGLGPVAQCMDINRGDKFNYLVSMSSPSRGLQEYVLNTFPAGSKERQEKYVLGDVNTSMIKTANGRTIFVSHDTNLPRPYSRIDMVQGTKGLFQGYPPRLHIEGMSPQHRWQEMAEVLEQFDHPLWKTVGEQARGAGHGGMDYLEDYRLIKCLREGLPLDMNVYDAAALSAVSELSERSVANGSQPMEFPDFTRGKWKTYPKLEIAGG